MIRQRRKLTPPTRAALVSMIVHDGLLPAEVAKALGIQDGQVSKLMRRYDLPMRPPRRLGMARKGKALAETIYRYVWGPRFRVPGWPVLDRKGQLCKVLARGEMNSALIEFEDGFLAVVSRNALRKAQEPPQGSEVRSC